MIAAAVANATAINVPQNIAVVDPSGTLVAFLHMDNAFLGSVDLSQRKAKTAVLFNGMSSGDLYAAVQPGAPLYGVEHTNGGLVVFGGGYALNLLAGYAQNKLTWSSFPIYYNGSLIGGVGVSGGSVDQDVGVAQAALLGIGASSKPTL